VKYQYTLQWSAKIIVKNGTYVVAAFCTSNKRVQTVQAFSLMRGDEHFIDAKSSYQAITKPLWLIRERRGEGVVVVVVGIFIQ
jgi:hypothetical protein